MKKLSLLSVLLLGYMIALAQNMGIGTLNPDPSAKLEISSIDKGLLIPRVNTTQRQGIINPATGLLVFDTDTKTFWYYNASSWINLDLLNAGGQDWKLTGNTGINPATQFLGTTDNQPII